MGTPPAKPRPRNEFQNRKRALARIWNAVRIFMHCDVIRAVLGALTGKTTALEADDKPFEQFSGTAVTTSIR